MGESDAASAIEQHRVIEQRKAELRPGGAEVIHLRVEVHALIKRERLAASFPERVELYTVDEDAGLPVMASVAAERPAARVDLRHVRAGDVELERRVERETRVNADVVSSPARGRERRSVGCLGYGKVSRNRIACKAAGESRD